MTAQRSLTVVMSGPEATAGSTPNLQRSIGIAAPVKPEIIIDAVIAAPTHPDAVAAKSHGYFPITER